MAKNYQKTKFNPLVLINRLGWKCDHISFNPALKHSEHDFFRIRGSSHDGTFIFTYEILEMLLSDLANMQSFSLKNPPADDKKLIGIKYELGWIKLATVFGTVDLPCGRVPGQRERARVSVKCEYVYD